MKRSFITFCIVFVSVSVLFLVASLAPFEIRTLLHGSEFDSSQKIIAPPNHEMVMAIDEAEILKVLSYTDEHATVYYVIKDFGGWVMDFYRVDEGWQINLPWRTVWATRGSADDFVWPYFWHNINDSFWFVFLAICCNIIISLATVFIINKTSKDRFKRGQGNR